MIQFVMWTMLWNAKPSAWTEMKRFSIDIDWSFQL